LFPSSLDVFFNHHKVADKGAWRQRDRRGTVGREEIRKEGRRKKNLQGFFFEKASSFLLLSLLFPIFTLPSLRSSLFIFLPPILSKKREFALFGAIPFSP
jgi:hypothetical protein